MGNPTDKAIADALTAAKDAGQDLDELVEVTVTGVDSFGYTVPDPARPGRFLGRRAERGESPTVTRAEAIRGAVLGAVKFRLPGQAVAGVAGRSLEELDAMGPRELAELLRATPPAEAAELLEAIAGRLDDEAAAELAHVAEGPAPGDDETEPTAGTPHDVQAEELTADEVREAGTPSDLTDDELEQLDAPATVAHLGQWPGDTARVRQLEEARPKPRVTVLRALGLTEDEVTTVLEDSAEDDA